MIEERIRAGGVIAFAIGEYDAQVADHPLFEQPFEAPEEFYMECDDEWSDLYHENMKKMLHDVIELAFNGTPVRDLDRAVMSIVADHATYAQAFAYDVLADMSMDYQLAHIPENHIP